MYKRVGKGAFFIVLILIVILGYITIAGIPIGNGHTLLGVKNLRLGIDIKGGYDVTFIPSNNYKPSNSQLDAAYAKLAGRLDAKNISDRTIIKDYKNHSIEVRWPLQAGSTDYDPEKAIEELGATANLNFKGPDGTVILNGDDVESAQALPTANTDFPGSYYVELKLKASGATKFSDATKKYINQTITINMDNTKISDPTVSQQISDGTAAITGSNFTASSANALASKINAGALPFSLISKNYSYISPTLGMGALNVMLWAGMVAFIMVCLFMFFYYRVPGFVACIGLCGHLAGMIFSMLLFNYTLTLPGIAGFILSVGMGVDCNIITAERIKEELREGRTIDGAIDQGFDLSFTAIFDGNITVIIAGVILMWLGQATVQSFGFTLVAGVVFNFIMGIIASRIMLKSVSKYDVFRRDALYGEVAK